jgi:outer membrane protein assembly factor BamB
MPSPAPLLSVLRRTRLTGVLPLAGLLATASPGIPAAEPSAANWPQFRGPGAMGRSESGELPVAWADDRNVVWKAALPGPGASSPVVWGDRIFLTCHTGYAVSAQEPGALARLTRHVLCLDRATGRILWKSDVPADQPEQDRIREDHGYASSTPAVDAERVYVFFGKSGVLAFDHAGREQWRTRVGDGLNGWGSATSPVLHGERLLVNASVESESLVALDRRTGRELWRAGGVKESWHAPVPVSTADGRTEVVVAMIERIRAFDAERGEPLWHCDTGIHWYMCPTPLVADGIVYAIGGRNPNGSLAVRAGGRGDVTKDRVVWKLNKGSNVPSPILHEGHLYFAHENLGIVYCVNATTGAVVYEERLTPSPGQIYASPLLAGDRLYFVGRGGRTILVAARPRFEVLGDNVLEGGRGVFNASPAAAGSHLLLRSNRALYCLGTKSGG